MRDGRLKGPAITSRFPAVFRLPALRFSVIRFPPRGSAFLTVGLLAKQRRTATGVTAFRTHELRSGWVPPVSRGRRCSSRLGGLPSRRLPLSQRPVLRLRSNIPSAELTVTRHQPEVQVLHPSDLPLACSPRMERAPLGFCLMLRTPPGTPATHVRPRPGPEHEPGTTPSISVEPPINAFTHVRATSRRKPVRSSPRPRPRDGTGNASASPRASHPAVTSDARQGRGQAIEHGPWV